MTVTNAVLDARIGVHNHGMNTNTHTDTEWREVVQRGRQERELRARLAAGADLTAGARELADRVAFRSIAQREHDDDR